MIGFPLLLVPLAIYNIIVFLMPGVVMTAPVNTLGLPSGANWQLSFSDILIALALLLLIGEMAKAARPGKKSIVDHALALILFGAALAEFLLLQGFATSTFLALVIVAFVDFAGSIAVQAQRASAVRAAVRTVSDSTVGASPEPASHASRSPDIDPPSRAPDPVADPYTSAHAADDHAHHSAHDETGASSGAIDSFGHATDVPPSSDPHR